MRALFALLAMLRAGAQCSPGVLPRKALNSIRTLPSTDSQKIADALRAGPKFITDGATIVDWPPETNISEWRVLRNGTNQWTCLPAPIPGTTRENPACADEVFFKYIKDSIAGRPLQIDGIGVAYMLQGDDVSVIDGGVVHIPAHVMIVTPHQADLQRFVAQPYNGTYINHLYDSTWFLVVPIGEVVLD
ncbi:hypothetical protein F5884DRAFT_241393 [Xylogone sp. PMI_703]|nr:hypothetical protein F5884DRAFT_241393 [Xylogone sp. PMI_703]